MNASDRIRQAIEALPEWERTPWKCDGHHWEVSSSDGAFVIAAADEVDELPRLTYIALMDPKVGAALADLLDILSSDAWEIWRDEIREARTALVKAIEEPS